MGRVFHHVRRTLWLALDHDVFNTAKAAAYSGMLCFFPAVLVVTALLAQVPAGPSLVGEMRGSLDQILPPESMNLLQSSLNVATSSLRTGGLVGGQPCRICRTGRDAVADGGFPARLQGSPRRWGFWERRLRALALVPIVLVPLSLASLLLVFGHQIEELDDRQRRSRFAPFRHLFLAHASLGDCRDYRHCGPGGALPLRHQAQGTLGLGAARRHHGDAGLVPRHPCIRLVRHHPRRQTTPGSTAPLRPGLPPWSGFTSPHSARCWARS